VAQAGEYLLSNAKCWVQTPVQPKKKQLNWKKGNNKGKITEVKEM
jgi:hypothetical protein